MKSTLKKIAITTLILGATSISAIAALPGLTAVVGDKAFDLNYINLKSTKEDMKLIQSHIVAGNDIYVKKMNGQWVDNLTGKSIDPKVLPEVTYKDENGEETTYGAQDGDQIDKNEFKVISIE